MQQGEIILKIAPGSRENYPVNIELRKYHSNLGKKLLSKAISVEPVSLGTFDFGYYSIHVRDQKYFTVN